jgi:hypothetical protein
VPAFGSAEPVILFPHHPTAAIEGEAVIIPFKDEGGSRNGFLAGEAVYNLNGRRIGRLVGEQVFDQRGEVVATVRDDQLTMVRSLPWAARMVDAFRSALRHLGLIRLRELPD